MVTVLHENRVHSPDGARADAQGLFMPLTALEQVSGPLGTSADAHITNGEVDVKAHWQSLGRPVAVDSSHQVWSLGASHVDRGQSLNSLQAPDFTLASLDGTAHSLSDYRGKKVFLATWSSW
ncbi:MAG: hypothetical protein ACI8PT_004407 [Gammaproteobacteria bacterium]|jgi:hypothetical protein